MAAGTVISGGFPGRVAQEVQPNHKCGGCLHYDGQVGRTGACTIGSRPWLCGEGDMQEVGYAPLARGAGSYLPDMSNHGAHAPEVPPQSVSTLYGSGSTRPVEIRQVSLGEEHVHLVKSMVEGHVRLQKSQCNLCSMQGTRGAAPPNVGYQACTCAPIEAVVVAKAVAARMTNAQRAGVSLGDVIGWVRDVAKAGFRLPVPTKPRSLGGRVVDPERRREDKALNKPKASLSDQVKIDGNGGHLRPVTKSSVGEGFGIKQFKAPHGNYTIESQPGQHTLSYEAHGKKAKQLSIHNSEQEAMNAAGKHHAKLATPKAG